MASRLKEHRARLEEIEAILIAKNPKRKPLCPEDKEAIVKMVNEWPPMPEAQRLALSRLFEQSPIWHDICEGNRQRLAQQAAASHQA